MDDSQLQHWVERISLEFFGRPFLHRASFNRRLKSTGGRYFPKSHNIDISWLQYEIHGSDEVEKIIKHELCHYHLHILKKGYQHRDTDFKQLLQQVGGSRFCKAVITHKPQTPYRYRLECVRCKTSYLRKRRMNPHRYACGKCRGKLQLYPLDLTL